MTESEKKSWPFIQSEPLAAAIEELRDDSKGATFAMRHAKSPKGTLHAESVRQPERTKETPKLRETHSDTARTCSYKQSDGNTLEVSQLSQLLETFSLPAEEQRLVGLAAIHNVRDVKRSLAWIRDKVPRD